MPGACKIPFDISVGMLVLFGIQDWALRVALAYLLLKENVFVPNMLVKLFKKLMHVKDLCCNAV